METTVKLYTLGYSRVKTYVTALLFVAGNIVLPQLFHLVPQGGLWNKFDPASDQDGNSVQAGKYTGMFGTYLSGNRNIYR